MIKSTQRQSAAIFGRLRKLDASLSKENKNVRVDTLIEACILEGINAGDLIVWTLHQLEFNKQHVRIRLNKGAGTNTERFRWYADKEGRFLLHGQ